MELIERSSCSFDKVIVVVATNTAKQQRFSSQQRVAWLEQLTQHLPNVSVQALDDALVGQFAEQVGAIALIRGVRNTTDFDYEYSISTANRVLFPTLDTILLYASESARHLSSSIIKEIAKFGGDVSTMVPACVAESLKNTSI